MIARCVREKEEKTYNALGADTREVDLGLKLDERGHI